MNPFSSLKESLLARFPEMHDVIFVLGKTSRAFWLLLLIVIVMTVREAWVRLWRKDLAGEAFELNQAFAFASLAYALQAPYTLAPELSWKLVLAVITTILIYLVSLVVIRLFCARSHALMIKGSTGAAMRLGLYMLGAGFASHAVVTAAFAG